MRVVVFLICLMILLGQGSFCSQNENEAKEALEGINSLDAAYKITDEEAFKLVEAARSASPKTAVESYAESEKTTKVATETEVEDALPLASVFDASTLGYMICYPGDWVYETPTSHQIVFSGKEGTEAYYSTVSIQNILSAKEGGKYESVAEVADDVVEQLKTGASEMNIYDEKPFSYNMKDGHVLKGLEFKMEYVRQSRKFRQWLIILQRPSGEAFHIWSYTSPEDRYNTYYDIARKMLESWDIN
ncbi:MAG: hypothetical protein NC938_06665 [Candidatus Omnitrophica bacterium]|nr:hypothetical protein [Candidatus Omnitrophota bacterium]MCM8791358.1 hypothetical protein [Candidatus Omnitrophota bacterium]